MSRLSPETQAAIRELLRRKRCQESLHSFTLNVDVPTAPKPANHLDEDLFGPARKYMPAHHALIDDVLTRTMNRPFGRAMIFAPPGSVKSLKMITACAWEMGRKPGARIMYTSYATKIAERQARRAMLILGQPQYKDLWNERPTLVRDAVGDFELSNGSNMLAMGLTAGLTGNRASGFVVDDPVAGREEADSEADQQKVLDAYQDDLLTRLLPGAWGVLIMTRWNANDLAGQILPDDYDGRSGMVQCKDGLEWEVLSIPAEAESADDPLGRPTTGPTRWLWPEWFPEKHWLLYKNAKGPEAARRWAALYQQRPDVKGAGRFHETMFDFYQPGAAPPLMAYIGAGDYAVTQGKNDFSEIGIFGVDPQGDLWEMDWWSEQCDTGKSLDKSLSMIQKWKARMFFNEGGLIDKAIGPFFNLRARERKIYVDRRALPSNQDKVAKCSAFQAMAAAGGEREDGSWNTGRVHFRDNANSRRVVRQLCQLPAGRYDDAADVCGNVGRGVDQFPIVRLVLPQERLPAIRPFSVQWLMHDDTPEKVEKRYR